VLGAASLETVGGVQCAVGVQPPPPGRGAGSLCYMPRPLGVIIVKIERLIVIGRKDRGEIGRFCLLVESTPSGRCILGAQDGPRVVPRGEPGRCLMAQPADQDNEAAFRRAPLPPPLPLMREAPARAASRDPSPSCNPQGREPSFAAQLRQCGEEASKRPRRCLCRHRCGIPHGGARLLVWGAALFLLLSGDPPWLGGGAPGVAAVSALVSGPCCPPLPITLPPACRDCPSK
jgi:hypothetical protein